MSEVPGLGQVARRSASFTITSGKFAGKQFEVWALGIQDLVRCQEEALSEHKRSYIQTYTGNADLIPEPIRDGMIRDAFQSASKMTYDDLPAKEIEVEVDVPIDGKPGKTAKRLRKLTAEYILWWMSKTLSGQLHTVWLSLHKAESQKSLTIADIDLIFIESPNDLKDLADLIAELSEPQGNEVSDSKDADRKMEARRRRRKRKKR